MANITLDSAILLTIKQKVVSEKENLVNNLNSIIERLQSVSEVYTTNGGSQVGIDNLINTTKNLKNGYENRNANFVRVLEQSIAEYQQQDANANANISALSSGGLGASAVGGAAGIAAGSLSGKVGEVSDKVVQGVEKEVKQAVETNGVKPITGEVIDSNDPLVKGLANVNGGEVVRMADGRIAVRDETGSGVIFNKDGTTEAVTTKPTILASGDRTSGNSNGRDPYTQEVAQVLHDEGYSDKQVDKFINSVDKKIDKGTLSEELSIDTGNLRDTFENGPGIERGPGVATQNTSTETVSTAPQTTPVPEVSAEPERVIVEGIHGGPGVTVAPSQSGTVEAPQPAATTAFAPEAAPESAPTIVEGLHGGPGVTVEPGVAPSGEAPQPAPSESPVVSPTKYVPNEDVIDEATDW